MAKVGTYYGDVISSTSSVITVHQQKYEFEVTVSADPGAVTVPDGYTVTATTTRSVAESQRYWIRILDAETNSLVTRCSSGTVCSLPMGTGWNENANPKTRRFRAEVGTYYGDEIAGVSETITVPVLRYIFGVTMAFANPVRGSDDKMRFDATATSSRSVTNTPYRITIRRSDGQFSALCTQGTTCTTSAESGYWYKAAVEDYGGRSFGESYWYELTDSGAVEGKAGVTDLWELAKLFPSAAAVCDSVLVAPYGTPRPDSSVKEEWWKCRLAAEAGQSSAQALIAVATAAATGALVVGWLALDQARKSGVGMPPSTPPPTPPDEPKAPDVPHPLPRTLPTSTILSEVIRKNPKLGQTQQQVEVITEECIGRSIDAGVQPEECSQLPVFITGMNASDAADHDLEVLAKRASLVKLNYEDPALKLGPRNWYKDIDPCPGAQYLVTACDEYPFYSTEQGGAGADERPAAQIPGLKVISWGHNSSQGGSLGVFQNKCNLTSAQRFDGVITQHGDPYISLPIPREVTLPGGLKVGVPSLSNLCNGKAGSNP